MRRLLLFMMLFPTFVMGQSQALSKEDPRGVYKLMTITSYGVEQNAPYDQYKICTDSVSLTLAVSQGVFQITNNDKAILNYTGEETKGSHDTKTKIFDSDKDGFTLKWWSTTQNHIYFPYNDWCIEKYKSGEYSPAGKAIFDMLQQESISDKGNPLLGTWRVLGHMDELVRVKDQLAAMYKKNPTASAQNNFLVFMPDHFWVVSGKGMGAPADVKYEGRNVIHFGNASHKIRWQSDDLIIVEYKGEFSTNYEVYERVTDNRSMLSRLAGWLMKQ